MEELKIEEKMRLPAHVNALVTHLGVFGKNY
jgi:hypothetical protein